MVQFIHFKNVNSPFGFLYLVAVAKNGVDVPKNIFAKNSSLSRWAQVEGIFSILKLHEIKSSDHLKKALESLDLMLDCHDSPHFQFITNFSSNGLITLSGNVAKMCIYNGSTRHLFMLECSEVQNILPFLVLQNRKCLKINEKNSPPKYKID